MIKFAEASNQPLVAAENDERRGNRIADYEYFFKWWDQCSNFPVMTAFAHMEVKRINRIHICLPGFVVVAGTVP